MEPKTVLIIEDNPMNQKLFTDLLRANGFQTASAMDGATGYDLAKSRPFDLIILDIQLPDTSGVEVLQRLRGDTDLMPIPAIAVTAFAMKGDEERFRAAGFEDYLSKPIALTTFISAVRTLVAASS